MKLVAVVLADHADNDGVCWPSYRKIAERTGVDERTVRRHVKYLIELGVLTKLRTGAMMKVGEKSVNVTNAYRINEDILRRFPLMNPPKLSTTSLGISERFVHPGVVNTPHTGGGPLSTKPSYNHQYNRKHDEPVDNSDGLSVGDILNSILGDGTLS